MRVIIVGFILYFFITSLPAQKLKVSENNRFIVQEDGTPFFWMADTAWELFHRCSKADAVKYLTKRADQGFNVVQACALAELDGLNTPNANGDRPLINNNPLLPNEKYFQHVDNIISEAKKLGIYIALLPTWGDKVFKDSWGEGPEIFDVQNAGRFGSWLGDRYKNYDNIVWIIGGDRNPRKNSQDTKIWNAMAEGIASAVGGYNNCIMSFHPQPHQYGGSSTWFHNENWLDFNMHQTGHCPNKPTYLYIQNDYNLNPVKPVLDGEPLYEDHPNCFNAKELGNSIPEDIRRIMYWNVFAGAFGQTYGCHDVWQMYNLDKQPINGPSRPWMAALDLPMANQVKHLKNLILSRPFLTRIPDQKMIISLQEEDDNYVTATRDINGSYAMFYFPTGKEVSIDLSVLNGKKLIGWWYDTRTGNAYPSNPIHKSKNVNITPPTSGIGHDWVLVIDSKNQKFMAPGKY